MLSLKNKKIMENNDNGYTPNKNLELTEQSEITRLRKVIEEKNELIAKFKEYDARRSDEFRRLQQNYKLMEERFEEFNDAINACDDIEYGTKGFYKEVINRLYKGHIDVDVAKSMLQIAYSRLLKLDESFNNLEFLIMTVGNVQKRSELLNELRKMKGRYGNIVGNFNNKMNQLK